MKYAIANPPPPPPVSLGIAQIHTTPPCDFTNNLDRVNAHLNFGLIICNSHMYNRARRRFDKFIRDFIVLIDERDAVYMHYNYAQTDTVRVRCYFTYNLIR